MSNQSHPGRLLEGGVTPGVCGSPAGVIEKKKASLYQAPRAVRETGFSVPGLGMRPRLGVLVCNHQHVGAL